MTSFRNEDNRDLFESSPSARGSEFTVTNSGVSRPNPQGANTVSSELEFHYGNSHLKDFGLVRKTNKLEVKLFCQVSKSAKSLQALYIPLRIGKHCQSAALSGDEPKITFSPESAKRSTNTHFQVWISTGDNTAPSMPKEGEVLDVLLHKHP